jgi:hypothetical protein
VFVGSLTLKDSSCAGLTRASIKMNLAKLDGLPGHGRAEATPFFERLCPAMTSVKTSVR